MHYTKQLTVPLDTAAISPASTTIVLPAGILDQVKIYFPGGCARLVHAQIYDGATLLYPKGAATDYAENQFTVDIKDMIIWDSAKTLTLKGWSPGTGYAHLLTFHFFVRTAEEICLGATGYY